VKPEARATGRAPSRPNSFSEANGKAALQGPAPVATAAVATSPTGFTAKPHVEGPLVEAGLALAATALALTAAERARGSEKAVRGRADGR
jgi:hypothetical protein